MTENERWDYLVDLRETMKTEIVTLMHGFSLPPSGKPMEYCLVELAEINARFHALEGLSKAISCLANMRSLPIDWTTAVEGELPF